MTVRLRPPDTVMPPTKTWVLPPACRSAGRLARDTGVSPLLAQLLINRGIDGAEEVGRFLDPRLDRMTDPMLMKGMSAATEVIVESIDRGERITVYGDYDADGLTATALLVRFFSQLGVTAFYYIPNRLSEGYGLHGSAVEEIARRGTDLLITVDCGSSNGREIEHALALGMKVVVTDHHRMSGSSGPGCPVVNPHQPDCPFPHKELSGVGVAFMLAVAVRAALRGRGRFEDRAEPDLRESLDLVALGTMADSVPLRGHNRLWVTHGLRAAARTPRPGIAAVKQVAGIGRGPVTGDDFLFKIAPRLNAPGRAGDSDSGIRLLLSGTLAEGMGWAVRLDDLNTERRRHEQRMLEEARDELKRAGGVGERMVLVMASESWHKGVLGIVASRLAGEYHRPTLLCTLDHGKAVGSGRSIEGFDLHGMLSECAELFDTFGGHEGAAGFAIPAGRLPRLEHELNRIAAASLSREDLVPVLRVDAEVPLDMVNHEMIRELGTARSPWSGKPGAVLRGTVRPCGGMPYRGRNAPQDGIATGREAVRRHRVPARRHKPREGCRGGRGLHPRDEPLERRRIDSTAGGGHQGGQSLKHPAACSMSSGQNTKRERFPWGSAEPYT